MNEFQIVGSKDVYLACSQIPNMPQNAKPLHLVLDSEKCNTK